MPIGTKSLYGCLASFINATVITQTGSGKAE